MDASLNEVEAAAKKAARGAGHSWGIAEEAGKATRWLSAQGFDGCAALARLLARFDGAEPLVWAPIIDGNAWKAPRSALCPLLTGAAISDRAKQLGRATLTLDRVAEPLLLLPFAAMAARQLEAAVTLSWPDGEAVTDGEQTSFDGEAPAVAEEVTLRRGGALDRPRPTSERANPDTVAWGELNRFASRTYAPATEESRRRGAGSGLTDND